MSETNTETVAPAVTLTRRDRLVLKYSALLAKHDQTLGELTKLNAEIIAIDALDSVAVGTAVLVSLGRADTARTVEGVIIGVREDEAGAKSYKVQHGTGFDADIVVVKACSIALPPAAPVSVEGQGQELAA